MATFSVIIGTCFSFNSTTESGVLSRRHAHVSWLPWKLPVTQAHADVWCCSFPSKEANREPPVIVSKGVEILKLLMQNVGIVKRIQACTSYLCLKVINEEANPFSASLRHLQDTAGRSGIMQGTSHTSLASKRTAGLNRNNLYSLHPLFSHSFLS